MEMFNPAMAVAFALLATALWIVADFWDGGI
jgi:hypothetical protein